VDYGRTRSIGKNDLAEEVCHVANTKCDIDFDQWGTKSQLLALSGLLWECQDMSAFVLYISGFVLLLGGLVYAAVLLHVLQSWIIVGALVLIGLGVMSAVAHTKRRDPPADTPQL